MSAIEKILQEDIEAGKIANLSTRPTDSRTLGGDGLTPKQLREKYDELPLLAINKINEILTAIDGGSATVDDILTMIKTPIPNGEDEYKTLYEVLEDVISGAFSMYQVVGENTLVNIIDGLNTIVSALDSDLDSHISNKTNPHEVTKAQVGLGNVDNTSDANKPISAATQAALDLKASASQLSSALSDILSLQQKVGAQAIPFSDISDAINQLNDDVNTLQGGVVPRINRGIIQYENPSETVTPALASALTAFIVENFDRQPNNTDKVTVEDSQGADEGSYWSYQYWKGYDTLTDGWYWDSYAKIPAMNDIVAYYKNILIADWTNGTDGLYHIGVTAAEHGQGTSLTVLVDLYANVSGKFTRMNTFTPQTNGDIDIYTDTKFDGYVVIRSAKSHWFVPMEENPETLQRISDLEALALNPVSKTSEMTQEVGKDADGKLYTKPGSESAELLQRVSALESGKVDISTQAKGIYGRSQGGEYFYAISKSGDTNTIVQRDAGGVVKCGTPTANDDATPKTYVDTAVGGKLDKVTAASSNPQVYAKTTGGAQYMVQMKDTTLANSLIIRDANGRAQVADPSADSDIATKGFVNTAVGGKYTKPSGGIPETDLTSYVQTKLNTKYYRHVVRFRGETGQDVDEIIDCVVEVTNTRSMPFEDINDFASDESVNGKWLFGDFALTGIASPRTEAGSGNFIRIWYDSVESRIRAIEYMVYGPTPADLHDKNVLNSSQHDVIGNLALYATDVGSDPDFVYEL